MDIEFKDVPQLIDIFKKFFPPHYHIYFRWMLANVKDEHGNLKITTVINVKINDTKDGGEAEENWLLDYAYTLLKHPAEMDKCAQRWLTAFNNRKKVATLDILGHKDVEQQLLSDTPQ